MVADGDVMAAEVPATHWEVWLEDEAQVCALFCLLAEAVDEPVVELACSERVEVLAGMEVKAPTPGICRLDAYLAMALYKLSSMVNYRLCGADCVEKLRALADDERVRDRVVHMVLLRDGEEVAMSYDGGCSIFVDEQFVGLIEREFGGGSTSVCRPPPGVVCEAAVEVGRKRVGIGWSVGRVVFGVVLVLSLALVAMKVVDFVQGKRELSQAWAGFDTVEKLDRGETRVTWTRVFRVEAGTSVVHVPESWTVERADGDEEVCVIRLTDQATTVAEDVSEAEVIGVCEFEGELTGIGMCRLDDVLLLSRFPHRHAPRGMVNWCGTGQRVRGPELVGVMVTVPAGCEVVVDAGLEDERWVATDIPWARTAEKRGWTYSQGEGEDTVVEHWVALLEVEE